MCDGREGDGSVVRATGDEIESCAVLTHVYTDSGTYRVVLTATNPCGDEVVARFITIADEERAYLLYLPMVAREMGGIP